MDAAKQSNLNDLLRGDVVTGRAIVDLLRTSEKVPTPNLVHSQQFDALLDKAGVDAADRSQRLISADQLREIVEWATKGVAYYLKFGEDHEADHFLALGDKAAKCLRKRGEKYSVSRSTDMLSLDALSVPLPKGREDTKTTEPPTYDDLKRQEIVMGIDILNLLRTSDPVPTLTIRMAPHLETLLQRAQAYRDDPAQRLISADQLREIVEWATKGVAYYLKFGNGTEPDQFLSLGHMAIRCLRNRGEGYAATGSSEASGLTR